MNFTIKFIGGNQENENTSDWNVFAVGGAAGVCVPFATSAWRACQVKSRLVVLNY